MIRIYYALIFSTLLIGASAHAGGDKGGNAGDGMESIFRGKADEVLDWVRRTRLEKVKVGHFNREEITERLLAQKWSVHMSDQPVFVDGRERTCRNSFDPKRPGLIECGSKAFAERETEDSRYALIFHELLGVAGYEKNLEGESDDSISRQILRFIGKRAQSYLADEQIALPVVFIKNPVHSETGLPFTVLWTGQFKLICVYLGYREYIEGGYKFSRGTPHGSRGVLLYPNKPFEIFDAGDLIEEIVCR